MSGVASALFRQPTRVSNLTSERYDEHCCLRWQAKIRGNHRCAVRLCSFREAAARPSIRCKGRQHFSQQPTLKRCSASEGCATPSDADARCSGSLSPSQQQTQQHTAHIRLPPSRMQVMLRLVLQSPNSSNATFKFERFALLEYVCGTGSQTICCWPYVITMLGLHGQVELQTLSACGPGQFPGPKSPSCLLDGVVRSVRFRLGFRSLRSASPVRPRLRLQT